MSGPAPLSRLLAGLRLRRGQGRSILFTKPPVPPEATLAIRGLIVVGLFAAVMAVLWWDRAGLKDNIDGHISFTDVVYFTAVTITTVGYGDIVPVTPRARVLDALFITPIRLVVWLIFVGTAYQLVFQRLFEDLRMTRLQRDLTDHVLVLACGGSAASPGGVVAPVQVGGFRLTDAVNTRETVDVLTDLPYCAGSMQGGRGTAHCGAEPGEAARDRPEQLVVAVRGGARLIRSWEEPRLTIETGDLLIAVTRSNGSAGARNA